MKAKFLGLVAAVLCGLSHANAATVDLPTTVLGSVVDDAGGIADGTFDRVQSGAEVDATNNFTYRAVMEFAIPSLPAGAVVTSAQLIWTLGSSTDPPVTVQLYGYVGNGVLEISDALATNLLATVSVPGVPSGGPIPFSIDVTTFASDLVASNDAFAGFMFRLPVEPPVGVQKATTFNDPMLQIDYTVTPLPAALPLFATGLAGLGLLGWRRKRKAQAVA
jgi:hypothetical protein